MPPQTVVLLLPGANPPATRLLEALKGETVQDFEVVPVGVLVPDSTSVSVRHLASSPGEKTYQAVTRCLTEMQPKYVATLSSSCIPEPAWLASMLRVLEREYEIASCASQIRVRTDRGDRLDSAGMLLARDCFYARRGYRSPPEDYARNSEALCPNGLAALYRWEMLTDIGGLPKLFPEPGWDLEVGLRARCAGWQSWYAAGAVVYRGESGSVMEPSDAVYLEESARLDACVTFFSSRQMLLVPVATIVRHAGSLLPFRRQRTPRQTPLPRFAWVVARAHLAALLKLPKLIKERRRVKRRMSGRQMQGVLSRHRISVFDV